MSRGTPDFIDAYDPGLFPFVDTGIARVIAASDAADNNIESVQQIAAGEIGYFYVITLSIRWAAHGYARVFVGEEDTTNLYNIINRYGFQNTQAFISVCFPKPLEVIGLKRLWVQSDTLNLWAEAFAYGFAIPSP